MNKSPIKNHKDYSNLYYMLAYAIDELSLDDWDITGSEEIDSPIEFYIAYLNKICQKIYGELSIKYSKRYQRSNKPKGNIDIKKSIDDIAIDSGYLTSRYSVIDFDNEVTRTVKFAIGLIRHNRHKKFTEKQLEKDMLNIEYELSSIYENELNTITEVDYSDILAYQIDYTDYEFDEIVAYRTAIKLIKYIMNGEKTINKNDETHSELDEQTDDDKVNRIFESFIRALCKAKFGDRYKVCRSKLNSDKNSIFSSCKTDVTLLPRTKANTSIIIIDTKWSKSGYNSKSVHKYKVIPDYGNQIIAYCSRAIYEKHRQLAYGVILQAIPSDFVDKLDLCEINNISAEKVNENIFVSARLLNMNDTFENIKGIAINIIEAIVNDCRDKIQGVQQ